MTSAAPGSFPSASAASYWPLRFLPTQQQPSHTVYVRFRPANNPAVVFVSRCSKSRGGGSNVPEACGGSVGTSAACRVCLVRLALSKTGKCSAAHESADGNVRANAPLSLFRNPFRPVSSVYGTHSSSTSANDILRSSSGLRLDATTSTGWYYVVDAHMEYNKPQRPSMNSLNMQICTHRHCRILVSWSLDCPLCICALRLLRIMHHGMSKSTWGWLLITVMITMQSRLCTVAVESKSKSSHIARRDVESKEFT